jgi:hypothetical protein
VTRAMPLANVVETAERAVAPSSWCLPAGGGGQRCYCQLTLAATPKSYVRKKGSVVP